MKLDGIGENRHNTQNPVNKCNRLISTVEAVGQLEIHPALTSISNATSVNERFSLVTLKSSN